MHGLQLGCVKLRFQKQSIEYVHNCQSHLEGLEQKRIAGTRRNWFLLASCKSLGSEIFFSVPLGSLAALGLCVPLWVMGGINASNPSDPSDPTDPSDKST